jgi:hypothetical protein
MQFANLRASASPVPVPLLGLFEAPQAASARAQPAAVMAIEKLFQYPVTGDLPGLTAQGR